MTNDTREAMRKMRNEYAAIVAMKFAIRHNLPSAYAAASAAMRRR